MRLSTQHKLQVFIQGLGRITSFLLVAGVLWVTAIGISNSTKPKKCDGTDVTINCIGEDGLKYSLYVLHPAKEKTTKIVHHEATKEVSHIVHHDTEYGTRQVADCIKTNISYKNGTCALTRCNDGTYSGSTGRGTCSYHGGVAYGGGPWYTYRTETYVVRAAYDEKVIDVPAREAYDEEVEDPARDAYYEKILAK